MQLSSLEIKKFLYLTTPNSKFLLEKYFLYLLVIEWLRVQLRINVTSGN